MPDLRRLDYFLTVARERNFTRAAEQLHIAQPALSRQVRLLEQELGVALLHRTTHEFELTDAGRFLLERGPALLASSEELWRSVGSFASGERGELSATDARDHGRREGRVNRHRTRSLRIRRRAALRCA